METTLRLTMKNGDIFTGGYTRMELELEEFGYPDPYVETVIHDGKIYKVVDLDTVQISDEYQPRTLLPACILVIDIPHFQACSKHHRLDQATQQVLDNHSHANASKRRSRIPTPISPQKNPLVPKQHEWVPKN